MASYNNAVLCGRLTKDPEIRKTQTGREVCPFTLAVDRQLTREQKEQAQQNGQQTADFISCVAWDHSAEYLAKYAARGTLLLVSGRIQTRSYDGRDRQRKYVTEIIARDVQILTPKDQSQTSDQKYDYGSGHGVHKTPEQIDREQADSMPDLTADLPF